MEISLGVGERHRSRTAFDPRSPGGKIDGEGAIAVSIDFIFSSFSVSCYVATYSRSGDGGSTLSTL